jgi:hypothetical protein
MPQFDTYEYIGGFSLTSDCALAGMAQKAMIEAAQSTARTVPSLFFILFFILKSKIV